MADRDRITELAHDVLDIARNRLLVNLRYLDTALTFQDRAVYTQVLLPIKRDDHQSISPYSAALRVPSSVYRQKC